VPKSSSIDACHPQASFGSNKRLYAGAAELRWNGRALLRLQQGAHNNTAERAIKPFVLGRANWLFANTPNGARAIANLYELMKKANANHIEPYRDLTRLFR
jgi:hypothetical protein